MRWPPLLSSWWSIEDIRASTVARQILRDWASNELPHYAEPAVCPLQTVYVIMIMMMMNDDNDNDNDNDNDDDDDDDNDDNDE